MIKAIKEKNTPGKYLFQVPSRTTYIYRLVHVLLKTLIRLCDAKITECNVVNMKSNEK